MPEDSLKDHLMAKMPANNDPDIISLSMMDEEKLSTKRAANKEVSRLHVKFKDGKVYTFQYMYLDARSSHEPGKFVFTFVGAKHWQLTVEGRGERFWYVYDCICLRRWQYLREEVRDFADEKETVFTSITVTDVTPKD